MLCSSQRVLHVVNEIPLNVKVKALNRNKKSNVGARSDTEVPRCLTPVSSVLFEERAANIFHEQRKTLTAAIAVKNHMPLWVKHTQQGDLPKYLLLVTGQRHPMPHKSKCTRWPYCDTESF